MNTAPSVKLIKIGRAAKIMGVSIKTLRRWEELGKIQSTRTPGGTRLYSVEAIKGLSSNKKQKVISPTINLLDRNLKLNDSPKEGSPSINLVIKKEWEQKRNEPSIIDIKVEQQSNEIFANSANLYTQKQTVKWHYLKIALFTIPPALTILLIVGFIALSNFIPQNKGFLAQSSNGLATSANSQVLGISTSSNLLENLLSPFKKIPSSLSSAWINRSANTNSGVAQRLSPQNDQSNSSVLAEETVGHFLEINTDTMLRGKLTVDKNSITTDGINGISIKSDATGITLEDVANNKKLTITGADLILGQSLGGPGGTTATLPGLALTSTKNQITVGPTGGITGTLTWTPSGTSKTLTFPDITDTIVTKTSTDTLKNKTISGSDNTISNIPSSALSGSFTGITGLGTISTGTWNGTKIGTTYGGTGLTSYTIGDLIYSSASDTLSKLAIGTTGQVLTVSAGLPTWTTSLSSGSITADTLDFTELSDSMTLDANLTIAPSASNYSVSIDSGTLFVDTANNRIGINDITPSYSLDVTGTGNITGNTTIGGNLTLSGSVSSNLLPVTNNTYDLGSATYQWQDAWFAGNLTVAGNLIGASSGTSGYWDRTSTTLSPTNSGDSLSITGSTTIAPSAGSTTALTIRAAPSGSNNIFDVTSSDGNTSYFTIDSTGSLSGSAFKITDAANAIIGTAIPGGWTMNSNTFTYRRAITVTNNSGSTLPKNYQISITLSSADSNQVYSKSQTANPYYDFRTAWYNGGGTVTEVARNISSFTSSDVTFAFQLSANITNGNSDTYYIYYGNSALNSISASYSSYTGNIDMENFETASTFTSGDIAFILSDNASSPSPQQGTNSMKMQAMVDRMGTFATTSQTQLSSGAQALYNGTSFITSVGGTNHLYIVGGVNSSGTTLSTIYEATVDGSANIGSYTSTGTSNPTVSQATAVAVSAVDGGTGTDGTLDLSLGSGAGGCTGTGLSWNAGTSTCTIATATKSTFNFTTINVSVGTTLTTSGTTFPTLKATGNVTIVGTIDLAGTGFAGGTWNGSTGTSGEGSGGGAGTASTCCTSGGGGGYGGAGGNGNNASGSRGIGGVTYETDDFGSGGGAGWATNGAAGGGGIKIASTGTITVSGAINATGNNGIGSGSYGGGGGSGGRVYLQGETVNVSGTLNANGGNGGYNVSQERYYGGGGGGGKITLEYMGTIDTTGATITVNGGSGTVSYGLPGGAGDSSSSSVPPFFYILGGKNGSGTAQTAINKATINSDGTVGAFSATTQGIPLARFGHTSFSKNISPTNYIYILGGNDGSNDSSVVYKATVAGDGDITSAPDSASQRALPVALSNHATTTITISGTTYVYVVGGSSSGTNQTAIYRHTVDGTTGDISSGTAWATETNGLPVALRNLTAQTATVGTVNYLFVFGGRNAAGTDVGTVYRSTISNSDGSLGTFTAVGQAQLSDIPNTLSSHSTAFVSISSVPYFYTIGGLSGSTAQSTVYKSTLTSDMTNFTASKTISATDFSNKNDLQFQFYSNSTAANLMEAAFSEDGVTWQTTTFTATQANTWETKTWDISGIAAASKNGVTRLRFKINSAPTTEVNSYLDNLDGLMNASEIANTTSYGRSILGANNLAVNAQGTGLVQINYAASPIPTAGSGGFAVYDGTTSALFTVGSTGALTAIAGITNSGNGAGITFSGTGNHDITASAGTLRLGAFTGIGATTFSGGDVKVIGYSLCVKATDTCAGSTSGHIYVTGGTVDTADLAENYISADNLEPGDIVAMADDGNNLAVVKTTSPYQKQVLGIVSTQPGLTLNAQAATDSAHPKLYPIALSGRVPVKVSTQSGTIKTGDYLTSSSTPGVAIKATKPGQVIGKALENFSEEGIGKVMVFVNTAFADSLDVLANLSIDENGNLVTKGIVAEDIKIISSQTSAGPNINELNLTPVSTDITSLKEQLASMSARLNKLEVKTATDSGVVASTPPQNDILGLNTVLEGTASASTLSTFNLQSSILQLTDATISGTLKSLGETFLGNTLVAGNFSVDGTMSITGNSINSIACANTPEVGLGSSGVDCLNSGILYLQNSPLAKAVDFFSGKVTISKEGSINAKSIKVSEYRSIAGKSSGSGQINAGTKSIIIYNPLVKPSSRILVTPTIVTHSVLSVTSKATGQGFTVSIPALSTTNITFDWWIINEEPE